MSLRLRIALGFAAVALVTAAVVALATPQIVNEGFTEFESELEQPQTALATVVPTPLSGTSANGDAEGETEGSVETAPAATLAATSPAEQGTVVRLLIVALFAALLASLAGLIVAGRLTRPVSRLEKAASGLARGDLTQRSGLSDRGDEFGELGRTFDSMAEQIQVSDENRRRFLQDAVHELRTPLTVIDATSSAILDGVYDPERRHLETIRDQARLLSRIVDDLRTISLAEVRRLPLRLERLAVEPALTAAAAGFETRAAAGGTHLTVDAAPDLAVVADPDRFRQIVGALIDNALRHSPPDGAVRLHAVRALPNAARSEAAGSFVRVTVEDGGAGFAADSLARVFDRFYQGNPGERGSAGLGLSIVQALVEAQGGRVGAANRPEGGAQVWFELPTP